MGGIGFKVKGIEAMYFKEHRGQTMMDGRAV